VQECAPLTSGGNLVAVGAKTGVGANRDAETAVVLKKVVEADPMDLEEGPGGCCPPRHRYSL